VLPFFMRDFGIAAHFGATSSHLFLLISHKFNTLAFMA
jgi:hypothetical protein